MNTAETEGQKNLAKTKIFCLLVLCGDMTSYDETG